MPSFEPNKNISDTLFHYAAVVWASLTTTSKIWLTGILVFWDVMLHNWVRGLRFKTCKKKFFFHISALEDEHKMFVWNMRNHSPNNIVSHPKKSVLSATQLKNPQIQCLTMTTNRNSGNYGRMAKKKKEIQGKDMAVSNVMWEDKLFSLDFSYLNAQKYTEYLFHIYNYSFRWFTLNYISF